jgi:hypothetical protein
MKKPSAISQQSKKWSKGAHQRIQQRLRHAVERIPAVDEVSRAAGADCETRNDLLAEERREYIRKQQGRT